MGSLVIILLAFVWGYVLYLKFNKLFGRKQTSFFKKGVNDEAFQSICTKLYEGKLFEAIDEANNYRCDSCGKFSSTLKLVNQSTKLKKVCPDCDQKKRQI